MSESSVIVSTIGHSSRPLDAFLELLAESRIQCVVDVRRLPGSRSFPHFNAEALQTTLAERGIDYWHLQALCGRRRAGELDGVPPERFWTNASFARYAAYARSVAFREGIEVLLARARRQRCVLMCSEAVWWRCHRRIIADHLLARGHAVCHIMGPVKVVPASLTRGAQIRGGEVIYPAADAA